jgi:hypothetical protein
MFAPSTLFTFSGNKHAKTRLIAFANQIALCKKNPAIAGTDCRILTARNSMILQIRLTSDWLECSNTRGVL